MYTSYFGFNEKPFTLTPNPRFIFLSRNHKEAFAHLLYGINNHYGFIELIGEVGTGKTTVLRTLLSQLQDETYRTALIVNPCLSSVELLQNICIEFSLNSQSTCSNDLLIELNAFLLSESAHGRTVVLVIDEAQNLLPEVLEQIRLISNLETEDDKLIQIVLAGQPELGPLLERPDLRQLNQRIAVRYRLKSMNMHETLAYIRHRMEVAGETGGVSFTPLAIRLIYLYTRGLPRMINILCDRALLVGFGDEQRRISVVIVARAITELLTVSRVKRFSPLFTAVSCLLGLICILYFFSGGRTPGKSLQTAQKPLSAQVVAASTTVPAVSANAGTSTQGRVPLRREIAMYDRNKVNQVAFNAIAEKWQAKPLNIFTERPTMANLSLMAANRDLRITPFKGSLDEVLRFDLPFLAMVKAGDGQDAYCFAVTAVNGSSVSISPQLSGNSTLSINDLRTVVSGTYYLLWKNSGQIPLKIKPGTSRAEIRTLQQLLSQARTYNGAIDGVYNSGTAKAVGDFQQSVGIKRDETVTELTLAALMKYSATKKIPTLSMTGTAK